MGTLRTGISIIHSTLFIFPSQSSSCIPTSKCMCSPLDVISYNQLYIYIHVFDCYQVYSLWFIPYAYVLCLVYLVDFIEAFLSGETLKGWWNIQRGWMMVRVTSYLFAFIDTLFIKLGISNNAFDVTPKTARHDVLDRFSRELMDFSPTSPMITLLGTFVTLELFCFFVGVAKVVMIMCGDDITSGYVEIVASLFLQFVMNGMTVLVNLPIYNALFIRRDGGSMPFYVTVKSIGLAIFACLLILFL